MYIDVLNDFKPYPYNRAYLVGTYGDIFSTISNKFLKHYIDHDGYHRVDIYSDHVPTHIKVHKLVYETYIGDVPDGHVIRHLNDDKDMNQYSNLASGTQKENVADTFRNGHAEFRGHISHLVIRDKNDGSVHSFCPANKFIEFSGHSCTNGSITRMINSDWFAKKYDVLEFESGKV